MAELSLQHVDKIYDNNVQAVFDFNLEVKDKEFIVFVGPSGCGKSTTLRMIAGLEEISAGDFYIDGKRMNDVEPKDRDIAMVFLMDEPLSNLDAKLRVQMRSEIIQLHERIGATTIYVTHDQTEAMTMADRIVVMKGGYIQQIGTPKEIYNNPANLFVAGFLGAPATNFVKGTYTNGFFQVGDMKIEIPLMYREKLSSYQGKEIIMGIRPEDLHGEGIVADTYPSANFDFEIEVAELLGHEYILHGALNGQKMCAKVNSRLEPEAHSTIKLTMDLSKIHFFDMETENRID